MRRYERVFGLEGVFHIWEWAYKHFKKNVYNFVYGDVSVTQVCVCRRVCVSGCVYGNSFHLKKGQIKLFPFISCGGH